MITLAILLNSICLIIGVTMLGVYISIAYTIGIIIKSMEILIYTIILIVIICLSKKKRKWGGEHEIRQ